MWKQIAERYISTEAAKWENLLVKVADSQLIVLGPEEEVRAFLFFIGLGPPFHEEEGRLILGGGVGATVAILTA